MVVLLSRSSLCLSSLSSSVYWFKVNSSSTFSSRLFSVKFNSLSVINNGVISDRLSYGNSSWNLNSSVSSFVLSSGLSCNNRVVYSSCFTSNNVYVLGNCVLGSLVISFSNSNLSWYIDIYGFVNSLVIDNSFSCYSLSIDRSLNDFLSIDRSY